MMLGLPSNFVSYRLNEVFIFDLHYGDHSHLTSTTSSQISVRAIRTSLIRSQSGKYLDAIRCTLIAGELFEWLEIVLYKASLYV